MLPQQIASETTTNVFSPIPLSMLIDQQLNETSQLFTGANIPLNEELDYSDQNINWNTDGFLSGFFSIAIGKKVTQTAYCLQDSNNMQDRIDAAFKDF